MQNIGQGVLKNLWMSVPPLNEQIEIVRAIEVEALDVTAALERFEREVEFFREYRTRLVADVVTGKLDVREAAARLPAEVSPEIIEVDFDSIDDAETADVEIVL